ncbi:MAG TPA: anhydro-N-acetylmuramic acid kinase [Xanthomonadaceae bacterium]|nr:anhydro-N-acetylmuramic acid kinase [Xanthomonadaceae bacterium]
MSAPLYLGLISGTSADGIDAALVAFEPELELRAALTVPYADELRNDVLALARGEARVDLDALGQLDARLGVAFAEAALAVMRHAGVARDAIAAIGSHGQTVRHRPLGPHGFTMQLGDPARIVEATGITTVADFRRRDIAAGGQGAPLACAFHAAMLADTDEPRAVLNLGGIANLTLLSPDVPIRGFDTGPASALMDAWCAEHGRGDFDANGHLAASGTVQPDLLAALIDDAYFALPPPKSSGREYFHLDWLRRRAPTVDLLPFADVLATLLELTARSVAEALLREQPECARLLVSGGGVHNAALLDRLTALLAPVEVESTLVRGLDPDHVESMCFAWLAREALAARPANVPSVTGARGARVIGSIYPA